MGDTVQAHRSRSFDASCIDMLIVLAVVCKVGRVCQKIDPGSLPGPSSEHLKSVPERSRGTAGATSSPKVVPPTPRGVLGASRGASRGSPGRSRRRPRRLRSVPGTPQERPGDPCQARRRGKSGSSVPLYVRLARDVLAKRIFDDFRSIFGWSARSSTLTKYRACRQKQGFSYAHCMSSRVCNATSKNHEN